MVKPHRIVRRDEADVATPIRSLWLGASAPCALAPSGRLVTAAQIVNNAPTDSPFAGCRRCFVDCSALAPALIAAQEAWRSQYRTSHPPRGGFEDSSLLGTYERMAEWAGFASHPNYYASQFRTLERNRPSPDEPSALAFLLMPSDQEPGMGGWWQDVLRRTHADVCVFVLCGAGENESGRSLANYLAYRTALWGQDLSALTVANAIERFGPFIWTDQKETELLLPDGYSIVPQSPDVPSPRWIWTARPDLQILPGAEVFARRCSFDALLHNPAGEVFGFRVAMGRGFVCFLPAWVLIAPGGELRGDILERILSVGKSCGEHAKRSGSSDRAVSRDATPRAEKAHSSTPNSLTVPKNADARYAVMVVGPAGSKARWRVEVSTVRTDVPEPHAHDVTTRNLIQFAVLWHSSRDGRSFGWEAKSGEIAVFKDDDILDCPLIKTVFSAPASRPQKNITTTIQRSIAAVLLDKTGVDWGDLNLYTEKLGPFRKGKTIEYERMRLMGIDLNAQALNGLADKDVGSLAGKVDVQELKAFLGKIS